jgi:hypothetical protein
MKLHLINCDGIVGGKNLNVESVLSKLSGLELGKHDIIEIMQDRVRSKAYLDMINCVSDVDTIRFNVLNRL